MNTPNSSNRLSVFFHLSFTNTVEVFTYAGQFFEVFFRSLKPGLRSNHETLFCPVVICITHHDKNPYGVVVFWNLHTISDIFQIAVSTYIIFASEGCDCRIEICRRVFGKHPHCCFEQIAKLP